MQKTIKNLLSTYEAAKVEVFLSHCKSIAEAKDRQGKLKNPWWAYVKPEQLASLYKKVALDGLFIDGDTITLQYKGALMISYNYQAYKNKLLTIYPETLFDIQVVYKDDKIDFQKESGKVIYSHKIANPFNKEDKYIIGAYCVIKNNRGEFLETLDIKEIQKMRNVAKTQNIWNAWFPEMVLKSVTKRGCKRHFKDVVTNMEELDNANYDLEKVGIPAEVQTAVDVCFSKEELDEVYKQMKDKVEDEPAFLQLLTEKKLELEST